ncbi:siderophore-interacting protein [Nocardiopsis akebiae]|uniref:Siderophore-interacting protein n=1 Tax=Nocardiopsis akebiae TaxID=2831968 RepID=A0ABX8C1N3_9ACTN|nr:siderophore-interacting protein [Nocardiopsis akebiae]QUX27021.1 siderophore-interacting protein [Nocardiopsis akebiae]
MAQRQGRARTVHTGRVEAVEQITPHMVRVVLGGEGLDAFATDGHTDSYVKLLFPPPAPGDTEPFDLERVRAERPREEWPVTRTYTVRDWDAGARRLTLDFVHHGGTGLAGVWAAGARPGDRLRLMGPGGAYSPDPGADWHLLAGDESALPAIAAAVEALAPDATAHVFVEVGGPEDELKLEGGPGVRVHWLHRGDEAVGSVLVPAVRALDFPEGRVHAFVHGEAGFVRDLRRLLRVEHGLPKEQLSVSGYWRLGRDEDGWQSSKAEWNRGVEAEEEAALTGRA